MIYISNGWYWSFDDFICIFHNFSIIPGKECSPECYQEKTKNRHCWGSGPDKCQKREWSLKLTKQKKTSHGCSALLLLHWKRKLCEKSVGMWSGWLIYLPIFYFCPFSHIISGQILNWASSFKCFGTEIKYVWASLNQNCLEV